MEQLSFLSEVAFWEKRVAWFVEVIGIYRELGVAEDSPDMVRARELLAGARECRHVPREDVV